MRSRAHSILRDIFSLAFLVLCSVFRAICGSVFQSSPTLPIGHGIVHSDVEYRKVSSQVFVYFNQVLHNFIELRTVLIGGIPATLHQIGQLNDSV